MGVTMALKLCMHTKLEGPAESFWANFSGGPLVCSPNTLKSHLRAPGPPSVPALTLRFPLAQFLFGCHLLCRSCRPREKVVGGEMFHNSGPKPNKIVTQPHPQVPFTSMLLL